ncbi:MAG: ABC transporter permease [Sphingomicrobium sp.]
MMRFLRSCLVIARRDFGATVLSKTFIFFLLAPIFPLIFGGVFSSVGVRVASQIQRPVVAVVAPPEDFQRLQQARDQIAQAVGEDELIKLAGYPPERDLPAQQKRLLASHDPPVRAVLSGGFDHPRLVGAIGKDPAAVDQLRLLIANARAPDAAKSPDIPVTDVSTSSGSQSREREITAEFAQLFLFFITLFLAGMVMSQLIEEKSNKIIEVIAAAIPIDAMFVGKLTAMLSASIVGIFVWVSAGAILVEMATGSGIHGLPSPAVGWPLFLLFVIVYFSMNYLLIGSVFLMIGAQATTAREVQTLSMPATFGQFFIFWLASKSIGAPNSPEGLIAAVFPLSSPMTMLGRAAQEPQLWPHLVALVWQGIWVALILRLGAQLFRRTVLKSGPRLPWWRFGRAY